MKKFLQEFKEFALKGNVMDMAVGVIIGAAFQSIVNSLVNDIVSPLLGTIAGMNFDALSIQINGATLAYGKFITAAINFFIMAFVLFAMLKAINRINTLFKKEECKPCTPSKSDELLVLERIASLLEDKQNNQQN